MQLISKLFIEEYDAEISTDISEDTEYLFQIVQNLSSKHRHIYLNEQQNKLVAQWITNELRQYCDFVSIDGTYGNVIAGWGEPEFSQKHVIGGHYDSPPYSPGADDNASAIASLILLAKKLSLSKPKNVLLVAFNGEEEGLLGSFEFVSKYSPVSGVILEMVGYFTNESKTQQMPEGLPRYTVGNFLAIIGNKHSEEFGSSLKKLAKNHSLKLPVKALKIPFGLEDKLPGLSNTKRSDHYPFWEKQIPAVMLTDTAEFRNKNYHQKTDTPDTLNYSAMNEVVKLLELHVDNLQSQLLKP